MSNTVELTLLANDKATSTINGVTAAVRSLVGQFMAMAGLTAGVAGLGALVKQGVEFNKTMEDSKSGIASLILANNTLTDSFGKALGPAASLNQAFKIAEGVQSDLRKAALTTAASYQELVKGFQTAYGPATAAGITSTTKIREITVSAAQAVSALGLDSRQTSQELRALFTGEQGPDNTLTRTLGITKEEIDKVRRSGQDLGDYFISKLKPFADVAAESMGNFSTVISNLGDVVDQVMGEAFAPFFREIKAQAAGMGGALGGFTEGLGTIGQGLADVLRAVGPLIQAIAALGVATVKAGSDFLAAFAPIVPALTAVTSAAAGLVDSVGTVGLTAIAGGLAFTKLSSLATSGLYAMIGASAATDTAITALIGTVSLATVGWVALAAAIAGAIGYLIKWNYESEADDAWKRAADAQVKYIEVLEKKYGVTVEANAAEALLNVSTTERAAIMERVLKLDKDGIVTQDEVRSAMAAMTEETMRAKTAAASFATLQEKTKEKYQELLASLRGEIKIGGLEGLKKQLAEVAEEFRKKREQIRKEFFDPGTSQWAQDPKALLGLLGIREGQEIQKAAKDFAKSFKAVPEEITATWEKELKKLPDKVRVYYTAAQLQSKKTIQEWRKDLQAEIDWLLNAFKGEDSASAGVKAGWLSVLASIPTVAESAAQAVQGVWSSMARAFDDLFYNVLSGRLDSLGDVFRGFADNLRGIFTNLVTGMVERWLSGQKTIAEGWAELNKSMQNSSGDLSWQGGAMAAGTGYGIGSMVGQGTQANQIGAAAGAVIGAIVLSAIPVVGTILGAIVGGLIGELFNKNTERKFTGSIGGMVGSTRYDLVPVYAPETKGGPRGIDDGITPGEPIGWETRPSVETPRTAFDRAGQQVFEGQTAAFADLFRVGAKDQARQLIAAYQTSLKEMLSGAWVTIAAGSQEDIEKDANRVLTELLPRIGLSAAFGQLGYLPHGNKDAQGGMAGISWGMPGFDEAGNWTGAKQLFDPNAPIPKMLAGLGFTEKKIGELAGLISTDDPEKLLAYITGIVGVVVGLRDLGTEMGKTFDELVKGWKDEAAAGPAAAFGKAARDLAGQFDALSLYSGDEQLKKAQEAQAAASQFWESVKSYVQQLQQLADKLSAGLQGMREKMRAVLNPLSESGANEADWAVVEGTWGKLLNATDASHVEAATNEAAAAIERMFNVLAERITRGKALLERLTGLRGNLSGLSADVASDELARSNPLAKWGQDLVDVQRRVSDAARLSGLEQISAIEDVATSAETLYGNLKSLLSEISSVSASINKSISSQIWELGVGEMDPQGQASAITQRIKELQDQLALATSPSEIAAITSEIQSLTSRYVGQFDKNDPERADAIKWAQEQLERARGLAQEALDAMRAQAEAQAKELEEILKGAAGLISTNVSDAATTIGGLSFTLNELDKAMKEALERLGTAALDSLEPLREAMEGAAGIFTGATTAASTALTAPESGLNASVDRSAARLDVFTGALDRAITNLDRLANAGGGGSAPASANVVRTSSSSSSRTTTAQIVSTVRRFSGSLTPRVA